MLFDAAEVAPGILTGGVLDGGSAVRCNLGAEMTTGGLFVVGLPTIGIRMVILVIAGMFAAWLLTAGLVVAEVFMVGLLVVWLLPAWLFVDGLFIAGLSKVLGGE